MKGRCFMNFKKIITTLVASICILSMCVACSKDNTQGDANNPGNTITENDDINNNSGKNDLTDSMDELKDDVKDTADNIKDELTGTSDGTGTSMGTTSGDGAAN